jgi:hypothetical protein
MRPIWERQQLIECLLHGNDESETATHRIACWVVPLAGLRPTEACRGVASSMQQAGRPTRLPASYWQPLNVPSATHTVGLLGSKPAASSASAQEGSWRSQGTAVQEAQRSGKRTDPRLRQGTARGKQNRQLETEQRHASFLVLLFLNRETGQSCSVKAGPAVPPCAACRILSPRSFLATAVHLLQAGMCMLQSW